MSSPSPKASALVSPVYREHVSHFGDADDGVVYESDFSASPHAAQMPARIEVLIWHPVGDLDMTTFATIGMCDQPMTDAEHRAELHFAVRGQLAPDEVKKCSLFLANLATYPFHYQTNLDWWHKIREPGRIPLFDGASSVLLHPRFVKEGWDLIHFDEFTRVKLLNVIPISVAAYSIRYQDELSAYIWDQLVDPFTPW